MFRYSDKKYCILFHLAIVLPFIPVALRLLLHVPMSIITYLTYIWPFIGLLLVTWTIVLAFQATEKNFSEKIFLALLPFPALIVSVSFTAGFFLRLLGGLLCSNLPT